MTPPKNDKARKEWLASLKDGDEVAILGDRQSVITIIRRCRYREEFTDDQCRRFTLATGKERDGWGNRWIVPLTDELRAQIVRDETVARARGKLSRLYFARHAIDDAVTDDQALACAAIMWPEEFGGKS